MKSTRHNRSPPSSRRLLEICILAGGLGSRIGRDKSLLYLQGRTLLGHARRIARPLCRRVRTIRKDLVPRCGPLGGVYTALLTTQFEAILFLSCDMPFVSVALLKRLVARYSRRRTAVFVADKHLAGFPFLLPRASLHCIENLLAQKRFSLQDLAAAVNARTIRLRDKSHWQLFNINSLDDLRIARRYRRKSGMGAIDGESK